MDDKKIFSVVIPMYNGAETIENALASLLPSRQYLKEVIIANDRSTDNCIELAHQFDKMLPMVYTTVRNDLPHGPGNARNAGIDIATGEWIACLDCDDMFSMTSFTDIYNTIQQKDHEKLASIITSFVQYTVEQNIYTVINNDDPSYVHGHFYKKSFLDKFNIRFAPDILIIEDGYFNLLFNATCLEYGYDNEKVNGVNTYIWRIHVNHKGLSYVANPSHQKDTNYTIQSRLACTNEILKRFANKNGGAFQYARRVTLDSFLSGYFEYSYTSINKNTESLPGLIKWNAKIIESLTKDYGLSKEEILDFCFNSQNYQSVLKVYEMHFGPFIMDKSLNEFYNLLEEELKRQEQE